MKSTRIVVASLLSLLLAASLASSAYAAAIAIPEFAFLYGGNGAEEGQFATPWGVATDSVGNVYVTEIANHRVQVFDADGTFLRMWGWGVDTGSDAFEVCTVTCQAGIAGGGDGQFDYPSPVATAPDGSVYVGSLNTNLISKFGPSGAFISDFGGPGGGDGKFNIPEGLAVNGSGRVFVSDYNNHRIQAFGSGGAFLATWGIPGSGDGEFNNPQGLAFGLNGRLSIVDGANHRIQVFAPPTTTLSIKAPRSVEKGSVATIRGRLGSSDAACTVGQKVILRTSAGRRIAQGRTTATGAYALRATLVKTTRVSVGFDGSDECGGSRSAIKTIKVT